MLGVKNMIYGWFCMSLTCFQERCPCLTREDLSFCSFLNTTTPNYRRKRPNYIFITFWVDSNAWYVPRTNIDTQRWQKAMYVLCDAGVIQETMRHITDFFLFCCQIMSLCRPALRKMVFDYSMVKKSRTLLKESV